jgi:tetratricopeptide (TPR) repeat protein
LACEDETTLLKFVSGGLSRADAERVERHLDTCANCRQLVAIAASAEDEANVTTQPEGTPGVKARGSESVDKFGRYELQGVIARGGMGTVYAAYDPQLHRRVALKVIAQRLGDEGDARLLREAQAMGQLAHPNVVGVYDAGRVSNGFFIAMELVEGVTLRTWLAEPRSWREVLSVMREAGKGLAAAHAVGLVHRDFKPDNVLIANDGKVRVTDFGLVRSTAVKPGEATPLHAALTQNGVLMGSAGYLAPELLGFTPATAASDQFSFCVSLYEALYRQPPFPGESLVGIAVAAKDGLLSQPPAQSEVPRWLFDEVLRKGLASEPADRFESLDALLARLAKVPGPSRRVWLGAAAAAMVAIAGAIAASAIVHPPSCSGFEQELAGTWDETLAKKAADAFSAAGQPPETWPKVKARLQRYADGWLAARTQACVAHDTSPCLAQRKDELKALVEALGQADATTAASASQAVAGLEPPGGCPPAAPAAVRAELTRARTLLATGHPGPAGQLLQPVYAGAANQPAVLAEAALLYGEALHGVDEPACLDVWEHGVTAASAAGEDELLLRLLTRVITERGVTRHMTHEARALGPVALGVAARLGDSGRSVGELYKALAGVELEDGNRAEAVKALKQALRHYPKASPDAARIHDAMGALLNELGQAEAAKSELAEARAIDEDVEGAHAGR